MLSIKIQSIITWPIRIYLRQFRNLSPDHYKKLERVCWENISLLILVLWPYNVIDVENMRFRIIFTCTYQYFIWFLESQTFLRYVWLCISVKFIWNLANWTILEIFTSVFGKKLVGNCFSILSHQIVYLDRIRQSLKINKVDNYFVRTSPVDN